MSTSTQDGASSDWPHATVGWYALLVLLTAFLFSAIDRVILGLLLVPIKRDLGLSDAAMGSLLGIAFAVAFTVVGLFAGWLADRYSRRAIVAIAVTVWSLATAACGLASSFGQLLLGRVMVASGESALSPAAFSMISDLFPPKRLGRALGVYMSGAFLGAGISFIVGGAVLGLVSSVGPIEVPVVGPVQLWQLVFFIVGLPGLLIAAAAMTIPEPVRRGVVRDDSRRVAAVFSYLKRHGRLYSAHLIGFSMLAVIIVILLTWAPTMFIRVHGYTGAEVGLKLGILLLVLSPAGVFGGGWLVDKLQRAGRADAPFLVGILAALGSLPFAIGANLTANATLALALYAPLIFFATLAVACGPTAIQLATPNEYRAQISAAYLMTLNILTALFGATGVGFATDYLFANEMAVGQSMALMCGICCPAAALLLWWGCGPFRERAVTRSAHAQA